MHAVLFPHLNIALSLINCFAKNRPVHLQHLLFSRPPSRRPSRLFPYLLRSRFPRVLVRLTSHSPLYKPKLHTPPTRAYILLHGDKVPAGNISRKHLSPDDNLRL